VDQVLARLWTAGEQSGVAFAESDRDQILGLADGVADGWLDKVVTAITDNLPAGGVKNIEWGPIKGALLASEPQIDQATNDQISALFDRIVASIKPVPGG